MESTTLMTASSALSGLVSFLLEIALLVVALGPVHKHRPDASMLLAGSAGLALVTTILWYPATWILPSLLGASGIAATYAVIGLFSTMLRAAGQGLLLLGILRLAVPVNRDPTRYG